MEGSDGKNYCYVVANLEGWDEKFVVNMDGKTEPSKVFKERTHMIRVVLYRGQIIWPQTTVGLCLYLWNIYLIKQIYN